MISGAASVVHGTRELLAQRVHAPCCGWEDDSDHNVLRPSSRNPASVVSALIKSLAARLRQARPRLRLMVRGDSGISRPKVLRRLDA